jgi:hypothetical protein
VGMGTTSESLVSETTRIMPQLTRADTRSGRQATALWIYPLTSLKWRARSPYLRARTIPQDHMLVPHSESLNRVCIVQRFPDSVG